MTDVLPAITVARDGRGVLLSVRVQPSAARDSVGPTVDLPTGPAIAVRVGAPAIDGRANERVISLLAKSWDIPKSRISLVSGNKRRLKTISISGDPEELREHLSAWLGRLPASKEERTT